MATSPLAGKPAPAEFIINIDKLRREYRDFTPDPSNVRQLVSFGGEESAGASFLRRDGTVWTTDKDGLILSLLAAEITAVTGKDPGEHFAQPAVDFGTPYHTRIDAVATPEQKTAFKKLTPDSVRASLTWIRLLKKRRTSWRNHSARDE